MSYTCLDMYFKPIVLVTGFGPFVNHPVNASWEGVKLMNKEEIERKHNCELVTLEIPVTYENVDEFVPALWETHTPKFMMHVGVSNIANCFTLEIRAHKKGYQKEDYFEKCPTNNICPANGAIRMYTKIDIEKVCKDYNEGKTPDDKTSVTVSKEAGRYLCEYIYYTSLSVDNARTVFVHVPVTSIYTPEETARGLERILDLCLADVNAQEAANGLPTPEDVQQ